MVTEEYCQNKQQRDKNSTTKKDKIEIQDNNHDFWQYLLSSVVLAIKEGIGMQDKKKSSEVDTFTPQQIQQIKRDKKRK